jgi:hypothetical protein
MDPLHFCIAMGPLAVYLLLVGLINLSGRPFITSGARDTAALGVAISGFIVAGPMELFLPNAAATRFGAFVWLLLLAFYGLCLTLLVLLHRPRLIIYNVSADQLRPALAGVVAELDKEARWAGDCLVLPNLGVQLHVEPLAMLRNAQLVAAGPRQSFVGWRQLELALAKALRTSEWSPNPYGFVLIFAGLLIAGAITSWIALDRQGLAQSLAEMLRQG